MSNDRRDDKRDTAIAPVVGGPTAPPPETGEGSAADGTAAAAPASPPPEREEKWPPRKGNEGKRLFIGARVSVATSNALAGAAETLARRARDAKTDVKWVPPVNYHLTLKFLGWTRIETIGAIEDRLEAALRGMPRITFRTARIGAFPSIDKATVVWAGIDEGGGAPLSELARRIEGAMDSLGFAVETRPFHPHVTLGRLRENRPLKEVVLPVAEQMFGDTRIDAVTLFESETKSSGSVYREISRIEFKAVESTAERQTRAVDLGATNQAESEDTDDGWPRGQGPNH